ncbi:BTB/POZ domain-containing protein kctd1 [Cichlidogyrus casuarinus]|uniref:BTB/POZ domain-containing protein kctd1 n=1 Tax=Cichlidogyrus casuarinus TaxID=1844966 RepID=A0ABD2QGD8_9PLAT
MSNSPSPDAFPNGKHEEADWVSDEPPNKTRRLDPNLQQIIDPLLILQTLQQSADPSLLKPNLLNLNALSTLAAAVTNQLVPQIVTQHQNEQHQKHTPRLKSPHSVTQPQKQKSSLQKNVNNNNNNNNLGVPQPAPLTKHNAPVHIDVGGTLYTSSLETLTRFPNSKLCKMFNGVTTIVLDEMKQHYFIDRDGPLFRHVLNFLRTKKLCLNEDFSELDQLTEEVRHYELQEMLAALDSFKKKRQQRNKKMEKEENRFLMVRVETCLDGTGQESQELTLLLDSEEEGRNLVDGCVNDFTVTNGEDKNLLEMEIKLSNEGNRFRFWSQLHLKGYQMLSETRFSSSKKELLFVRH